MLQGDANIPDGGAIQDNDGMRAVDQDMGHHGRGAIDALQVASKGGVQPGWTDQDQRCRAGRLFLCRELDRTAQLDFHLDVLSPEEHAEPANILDIGLVGSGEDDAGTVPQDKRTGILGIDSPAEPLVRITGSTSDGLGNVRVHASLVGGAGGDPGSISASLGGADVPGSFGVVDRNGPQRLPWRSGLWPGPVPVSRPGDQRGADALPAGSAERDWEVDGTTVSVVPWP